VHKLQQKKSPHRTQIRTWSCSNRKTYKPHPLSPSQPSFRLEGVTITANNQDHEHLNSLRHLSPEDAEIQSIDWETLLLTLRENQILALSLVYGPPEKTVAFKEIYLSLRRIGQSQRTARRVIAELRGLGLIEVVHSIIGIAYPIPHLVPNIQTLIALWRKKRDHGLLPSSVRDYEAVLRLAREKQQHAGRGRGEQ